MRIIQLIDSLEAGGAERMAVHYANVLQNQIDYSGLIVSRKEGVLLEQLHQKKNYLFLDKKSTFDIKALLKFKNFIKNNKIEIVHAHGTSFFLAFLLKLIYPKIKLVWHDHYGDSEFLSERPAFALKIAIPFFKGIISVNDKLKLWNETVLNFENTIYLPNFAIFEENEKSSTVLHGESQKRIVCLANLRIQKNHYLLLDVAQKLKITYPDWSFHLVGKEFNDSYSQNVKQIIIDRELQQHVFFYGTKNDIQNILNQSTIAILTSESEGLPVALLEYGLSSKAVIATSVGEIPLIIENNENGILVESKNIQQFYEAIVHLINNKKLITIFGKNLNTTITKQFDSKSVIKMYLNWLTKI